MELVLGFVELAQCFAELVLCFVRPPLSSSLGDSTEPIQQQFPVRHRVLSAGRLQTADR